MKNNYYAEFIKGLPEPNQQYGKAEWAKKDRWPVADLNTNIGNIQNEIVKHFKKSFLS